MQAFVELLKYEEAELLNVVLEALDRILECGIIQGEQNPVVSDFDAIGGLSNLEKLQLHNCHEIYKKVIKIMEKYYKLSEVNAVMT